MNFHYDGRFPRRRVSEYSQYVATRSGYDANVHRGMLSESARQESILNCLTGNLNGTRYQKTQYGGGGGGLPGGGGGGGGIAVFDKG